METEKPYILGTHIEELHRLGYQHQVWSSEARKAWEIAEFSYGQNILDLGSGPGFCSIELGYLVGDEGKVIAADMSRAFLDYLELLNKSYRLNIETRHGDFRNLDLPDNSLDGIYSRWALAWISNPEKLVEKLVRALKPGGVFVIQEYFDWSTFQTIPEFPELKNLISRILKSFKDQEGDIDVGRHMMSYFNNAGLEVISSRPLTKYAYPNEMNWYWPKTFLNVYPQLLVESGQLNASELQEALEAFDQLEYMEETVIFCPSMIEIIAVKP